MPRLWSHGHPRAILRSHRSAPPSRVTAVIVALSLTSLGVIVGPAPASAQPRRCCAPWGIVQAPNPTGRAQLTDVVSLPTGTAWAVGSTVADVCCSRTVALHEVGGIWTQTPTPNPAPLSNRLYGVGASGDHDGWAVGSGSDNGGDTATTLVEHWDGSAWTVVQSPSFQTRSNQLFGIAARTPADAWAVGDIEDLNEDSGRTLIEHWDGAKWSMVPSPNGNRANTLFSVSATSASDAWAVGVSSPHLGGSARNMALHWDGKTWNAVSVPSPGTVDNALEAIVALRHNDVWAAGYATNGGIADRTPITLHWDGATWRSVPNPPVFGQILALAAAPGGNVWAAGYREEPTTTLVEHWNGFAWAFVPTQNPQGSFSTTLAGIAAGSRSNSYWAVGAASFPRTSDHTLIEHPIGTP